MRIDLCCRAVKHWVKGPRKNVASVTYIVNRKIVVACHGGGDCLFHWSARCLHPAPCGEQQNGEETPRCLSLHLSPSVSVSATPGTIAVRRTDGRASACA